MQLILLSDLCTCLLDSYSTVLFLQLSQSILLISTEPVYDLYPHNLYQLAGSLLNKHFYLPRPLVGQKKNRGDIAQTNAHCVASVSSAGRLWQQRQAARQARGP